MDLVSWVQEALSRPGVLQVTQREVQLEPVFCHSAMVLNLALFTPTILEACPEVQSHPRTQVRRAGCVSWVKGEQQEH